MSIWSNCGTAVLALMLAGCGDASPVPAPPDASEGAAPADAAPADASVESPVTPIAGRPDAAARDDVPPAVDAPPDAPIAIDAPAVTIADAAADRGTDLPPRPQDDGGRMPTPLPPPMAIGPCLALPSYVTGPATVSFPVNDTPGYSPPCLKVARGTEVTFTASSGDFAAHPLEPRAGGSPGSPIRPTAIGTSAMFLFSTAGFFPYRCKLHPDRMFGVVWVTD